MEMQQFDQSQALGNMQQSFGQGGQSQLNSDLNNLKELPEPGVGEKDPPKEHDGVVNPEIPVEGDPTPKEQPIIY